MDGKKIKIFFGLFLFIALLWPGTAPLRAVDVNFTMQSANTLPQGLRFMALYPIGGPYTNGAGGIITRDRMTGGTDSTGQLIISNLYGLSYRGEFWGTSTPENKPASTTNYYNFPVTNGYVYAATYAGAPTNAGGIIAYSQAQSDARYAPIGISGQATNAAITNAPNTFYSSDLFIGNQEFQSSVQFDGGILGLNGATIVGPVGLGVNGANGSSNQFQAKNAQGQYLEQVATNGYIDWGTNHQMRLDTSGNLSISGQINASGAGLTGIPESGIIGALTDFSQRALTNDTRGLSFTGPVSIPNGTFGGDGKAITNVLRSFITPFDCGAVGDNTTDDAAALQKWLFIASQSNWVAYLPPAPGGAFACSQTLLITNGMNHINILGTGGSIFVSDAAPNNNKSAIRWTAAVDGIRITNDMSNIRFDGIRLTNTVYSYATHGIWFDGTVADNDLSSLKSVECDGWGKGLTISSAADTTVENCNFGYCGDGVLITNGTYSGGVGVVNQVSFRGCQLSYCFSNSMNVTIGQYILIDSCDMAQGTLGSSAPVGLRIHGHGNVAMSNMHTEQNSGQQPTIIVTDEGTGQGNVALLMENVGIQAAGGSGANSYSIIATNAIVWLGKAVGLGSLSDNTFPVIYSGDINLWRSVNSVQARIVSGANIATNGLGGGLASQMDAGLVSNYLKEGEFLKSFNFLTGGNFVDSYYYLGARVSSWSGTAAVIPIDILGYFKDISAGGGGIQSSNGLRVGFTTGGKWSVDVNGNETTVGNITSSGYINTTNHFIGKSYALVPAATTAFWAPEGNAVTNVQTSDVDMQSRQAIGTGFQVVGLWCKASTPALAGQSFTFTVMTNGVATALVGTISGASATTASDFTHVAAVNAQGDSIGIKIVSSASAASARFDWDILVLNK